LYVAATRYCSLVESEGGIHILEEIIHNEKPYARIKELAAMVIMNCKEYREMVLEPDAPLSG
jgi:4-hydroxy-3-methylbut-2-enyl diphosphate reductase IspH